MSCHANFITWNKAYSMFPKSTFVEYKAYPLECIEEDWDEFYKLHFEELRQRGWSRGTWPQDRVLPSDFEHPTISPSETSITRDHETSPIHRRVGDRKSWVVQLDTTSVVPPSTPDWVIESSGFSVWLPDRTMLNPMSYCTTTVVLLESHSLQYWSV